MNFRVGQKVVCIRKKPWTNALGGEVPDVNFPRFGDILTIREKELSCSNDVFLRFEEIKNSPTANGLEHSFRDKNFRPVVERKTSIEVFQKIRRDVETNAPADLQTVE